MKNYSKLAIELLDCLGIEQVRWIGTSMGGAIGMRIAGTPLHQHRITHLVLNDIGAGASDNTVLDIEGIKRIISYVGTPPQFNTFTELKNYYKNYLCRIWSFLMSKNGLTLPNILADGEMEVGLVLIMTRTLLCNFSIQRT
ncbi:hypothetical protein GCM10020331_061380 [Ectobacillus funiculus]